MKKHYASSPDGATALCASTGFVARTRRRLAFTLTEVVLAVGVLSLAVVALIGLFGPTMGAVKDVVDRSGALGVSDHLNSQLLSNEVYDALEVDGANNSARFDNLAGRLIVYKPASTSGGTNTPASSTGDAVLYAWREYSGLANLGETGFVELKLDDTPPDKNDLPRIDGGIYVILLERGLQQGSGKYSFEADDVKASAYFPIQVSIYGMPISEVSATTKAKPEDYLSGSRGNPLFKYTTAKLR